MSWYKQSMPTIKDVSSTISQVCSEIKSIDGVKNVFLYGPYAENLKSPNYIIKDIDIIAATSFDSGDLLAIDNSKYSALRIHPRELEDEGFNPKAVAFTKRFLSYEKYNVDHWAASSDGKLLHWGAIPDNQDEWAELHADADKHASVTIGVERAKLRTSSEEKRKDWKNAYEHFIKLHLAKGATGWFASKTNFASVVEKAISV